MFQKCLQYRHNVDFKNFAVKLYDMILNDEVFKTYIISQLPKDKSYDSLSYDDKRDYLKNFANSFADEDLKTKLQKLCTVADKLYYFDDRPDPNSNRKKQYDTAAYAEKPGEGKFSPSDEDLPLKMTAAKNWDDAIVAINSLIGCACMQNTVLPNGESSLAEDSTNRNEYALLDQVHNSFQANNYADCAKNDIKGKLALHFGQLSEDMMAEVALFSEQQKLVNFEHDNFIDKEAEEKALINKINTIDKNLTFIPKDFNAFDAATDKSLNTHYIDELQQEIERRDNVTYTDEQWLSMIINSEETSRRFGKKIDELANEYEITHPRDYSDKLREYREGLEKDARQIEETNKTIEENNRKIEENNKAIDEKLAKLKEDSQKQLDDLKNFDFDKYASEETEKWKASAEEFQRLQNDVQSYEAYLQDMDKLADLAVRVENTQKQIEKNNAEVAKHRQTIDGNNIELEMIRNRFAKEEAQSKAVDELLNTLNGVGADPQAYTEDNIKKYHNLAGKLADRQEALKDYQSELNAQYTDSSYQFLMATTQQVKEISDELDTPEYRSIAAIDEFFKNNPDIEKVFNEKKNAASEVGPADAVSILGEMKDTYSEELTSLQKSITALTQTSSELENAIGVLNDNSSGLDVLLSKVDMEAINKYKKDIEADPDLKAHCQEKLANSKNKLENFPEVDSENVFEEKLADKIQKKKDEIAENIDKIEKNIEELEDSKEFPDELLVVPDETDINNKVLEQQTSYEEQYKKEKDAAVKNLLKESEKEYFNRQIENKKEAFSAQKAMIQDDCQKIKRLNDNCNEYYRKVKENNNNFIPNISNSVKNISFNDYNHLNVISNKIKNFNKTVDYGTDKNHHNTRSFNNMKESVSTAERWFKDKKNLADLQSGNPDKIKECKDLISNIRNNANTYIQKKNKGIHLISSNMRFVRLNYANDLLEFCDKAEEKINEHEELSKDKKELGSKAVSYASSNSHIEKFPSLENYIGVCNKKYTPKIQEAPNADQADLVSGFDFTGKGKDKENQKEESLKNPDNGNQEVNSFELK